MLFEKAIFDRLGGFHEQALYAEDYLLSKKVRNRKFGIVSGCIHTTNRRFRSMGHLKIVSGFLYCKWYKGLRGIRKIALDNNNRQWQRTWPPEIQALPQHEVRPVHAICNAPTLWAIQS